MAGCPDRHSPQHTTSAQEMSAHLAELAEWRRQVTESEEAFDSSDWLSSFGVPLDAGALRRLASQRACHGRVRSACENDLPALAALERVTFAPVGYTSDDLVHFYSRFPDLMLVLYQDGELAGYAVGGGRANPAHELEDAGWVNSLACRAQSRGHGFGGLLLDTLLDRFRERGLTSAMLYTEEHRAAALGLYASRGFVAGIDPHPAPGVVRLTLAVRL